MLFFYLSMIYIAAAILSSTSIYVIFRLAKSFSCNLSNLITLNYLVASVFGFGFFMNFSFEKIYLSSPWLFPAIILGSLFIAMFFLIGNSSQKAGITITTLANKVSVVFPVLFSLLWFHEKITVITYIAFFLAFLSIYLILYNKEIRETNRLFFILPLTIFFGSGITDSLVKYAQAVIIPENESAQFSAFVFLTAFIYAIVIALIKNKTLKVQFYTPTLLLGIMLGLVNFGSLFFLINALNKSSINSSVVFAMVNISIVILSAIIGNLFFKEKLNMINLAGVILAIVCLFLMI